jgi:hypothetical protein
VSDEKRENPGQDPDPNDPEKTADWSRYDPHAAEREARRAERDAHEAARDMERQAREMARQAREAAREAEHTAREFARDAMRAQRDAMRDATHEPDRRAHDGQDTERDERRAERRERGEKWRSKGLGGPSFRIDIDSDTIASRFMKDFVSDATGDAFNETATSEFAFEKMPRLRVRNISGATVVRAGSEPGKITVVAKKHVYASSEDRAKRLLQNLEIRMEKHGDELRIEPHLYEQERGWVDLFRGKRFRVDFDISVPVECGVDAQTVSGHLAVSGVRGPLEVQSVSGEISVEDVQGPMRLKSVSGDVDCRRYVGHVEGNTVSGDVTFDAVRVRSLQLHTVSGDVQLKGVLESAREHRFRTISGDIELSLADPDLTVDFRTASGDLESDAPARVTRQSRKEYTVILGQGRGHAVVKTVSGDLNIGGAVVDVPGEPSAEQPMSARPAEEAEASMEAEAAMDAEPAMEPRPVDTAARDEIKRVLEKLAKGELGLDDAAAALDAARKGR